MKMTRPMPSSSEVSLLSTQADETHETEHHMTVVTPMSPSMSGMHSLITMTDLSGIRYHKSGFNCVVKLSYVQQVNCIFINYFSYLATPTYVAYK